jgi:hypothetical protein
MYEKEVEELILLFKIIDWIRKERPLPKNGE